MAAWRVPRGLAQAENGDAGALADPLLANGSPLNGSPHNGATHNGGSYGSQYASQYTTLPYEAAGGMGRRTPSLQWLDKAAEVRVAGALFGRLYSLAGVFFGSSSGVVLAGWQRFASVCLASLHHNPRLRCVLPAGVGCPPAGLRVRPHARRGAFRCARVKDLRLRLLGVSRSP